MVAETTAMGRIRNYAAIDRQRIQQGLDPIMPLDTREYEADVRKRLARSPKFRKADGSPDQRKINWFVKKLIDEGQVRPIGGDLPTGKNPTYIDSVTEGEVDALLADAKTWHKGRATVILHEGKVGRYALTIYGSESPNREHVTPSRWVVTSGKKIIGAGIFSTHGYPGIPAHMIVVFHKDYRRKGIYTKVIQETRKVLGPVVSDLSLTPGSVRAWEKAGGVWDGDPKVWSTRMRLNPGRRKRNPPKGEHDELFKETIAQMQRYSHEGDPEDMMLKVTNYHHGAISQSLVEYGGDLLWRMTEAGAWTRYGQDAVINKTDSVIRAITRPYGLVREHRQNMEANARSRGISLKSYETKLDTLLRKYAEAHARLPTFNRAQYAARQVAVYIGLQDWKKALQWARVLQRMAQGSNWVKTAGSIDPKWVGKPAVGLNIKPEMPVMTNPRRRRKRNPPDRRTGWTVISKVPILRGSLELSTQPVMGWRDESSKYGTHRTRAEAMAAVIDLQMPEVASKPWSLKKRHWPFMTRMLDYRVVKMIDGVFSVPISERTNPPPLHKLLTPGPGMPLYLDRRKQLQRGLPLENALAAWLALAEERREKARKATGKIRAMHLMVAKKAQAHADGLEKMLMDAEIGRNPTIRTSPDFFRQTAENRTMFKAMQKDIFERTGQQLTLNEVKDLAEQVMLAQAQKAAQARQASFKVVSRKNPPGRTIVIRSISGYTEITYTLQPSNRVQRVEEVSGDWPFPEARQRDDARVKSKKLVSRTSACKEIERLMDSGWLMVTG